MDQLAAFSTRTNPAPAMLYRAAIGRLSSTSLKSCGLFLEKTPQTKSFRNIIFRLLGPGLVTGAADDDPSGIATYSQAGAQFGYGLLWTVFLTTPFMIAIQLVSAYIGRATGRASPPTPSHSMAAGLAWPDRAAGYRECHQHRGRHRGDERSALSRRRRAAPRTRVDICRSLGAVAGVRALSPLCADPQMADAGSVSLWRRGVHRSTSRGAECRARHAPASKVQFTSDYLMLLGRGARHHHKSLICFSGRRRRKSRKCGAHARTAAARLNKAAGPGEMRRIVTATPASA